MPAVSTSPREPVSRIVARNAASRRRARTVGAIGFVLAAVLPWLLWRHVISDIALEFRLDARYLLSEWSPWLLIVLGLCFFLPVAWSAGMDPRSRFYPRSRRAYAGWGITLYLLGICLATQVVQLHGLAH